MGTLFVVATPIGNLEDVTLRALRVLGEVDLLFAEDTRRTRILLVRHNVNARPLSLHAHNEARRIAQALETLRADRSVALVSDAGTPLVSDPGERLVAAARDAGHRVESIPGPSAVLAALTASGLPVTPFTFLGFPPRKKAARKALLEGVRQRLETLVLFESPRRLAGTLCALRDALGERRACVARELTKVHEEVVTGTLGELAERFAEGARGEVTIVVEGAPGHAAELSAGELDSAIRALARSGHSAREIAAALAPRTGVSKRDVYARAVAARERS